MLAERVALGKFLVCTAVDYFTLFAHQHDLVRRLKKLY
jgi:hypothetical protein